MNALTISVVYDNYSFDRRLKTNWGYAALIDYQDHTLLFDTGGDSTTLLNNLGILGIDPRGIQSLAISHNHGDHTGGLRGLLNAASRPIVYLLPSFPNRFKRRVGRKTDVKDVTEGLSFADKLFTTGEIDSGIKEQSLIIQTSKGLVIVTGCAHPGIVKIIEHAKFLFNEPIYLVMGGFHLRSKNKTEMTAILADFRRLGVAKVAPSHCTGDRSIAMFARAYGEDYLQSGAGKIIRVDEPIQ
jgi:7,8-dihydropterin-6-yl-methyl-4-(beta-D-ribofuranosyl)aminobenzene 5'-phosphate synthase